MLSTRTITRRQLLRASASALLAASLWPGRLDAADADAPPLRFIVINDLHYIDDVCGQFFKRLVQQLKATDPPADLCILAGDLSDHGTEAELGPLKEIFDALGMPVYVVPGNHDLQKPNDDRTVYDKLHPGRLNYTFEHKGWQFVGLDSTEGTKSKVTIQPPTLKFLDETLPKLDGRKPTIVFTHFPLGPDTPMRPPNADAVLERFKEHNLVATYGGHHHGFTERKVGKTVMVTNACCSLKRNNHDKTAAKGYFVCEADGPAIRRKFVEFAAAPATRPATVPA